MTMMKDKAAITGIGVTKLSKDSERTELYLACEAIKMATEDAGIDIDDLDGFVRIVTDPIDQLYLQKGIGIDNSVFGNDSLFGTAPMTNAVLAISANVGKHVCFFRTINGSSGRRFISDFKAAIELRTDSQDLKHEDYHYPYGLTSNAGHLALIMQRYMHEYGVQREDLGWVPIVCRENAARNPRSVFHERPITMDDYKKSASIVDPIRELDLAPAIDGAVAIVISAADVAKSLNHPPAYISAVAQGTGDGGEVLSSYDRDSITGLPEMRYMGEALFERAGISPKDITLAQLDDIYGPLVPIQLEELGFCKKGEGVAFCQGGDRIRVNGELPLNTAGGCIGEGNMQGINNVVEAVRQIRGTSTSQIENLEYVLVANGAGGPADGMILRR